MITLTGSLTREAEELIVEYRVRNGGRVPVYVAAVATDAAFQPHPASAYASLSPDELRLNLILGGSPLPEDELVEFQAAAWAVEVQPGGETTGRLRFPLPVREWNAYALPTAPAEADAVVPAYQVVLCVDVIRHGPDVTAYPTTDPPGYWRVGGHRTERLQQVFTPDLPVPVVKRADAFPRP